MLSRKDQKKDIIIGCLIVLFCGTIRLPSLTQPLGPDQGVLSVIGEGILKGKLLYKDFWEMGSPAIFFSYAGIFKLVGPSMKAVPIADIFLAIIATLALFILARYLYGRKIAMVSAVLYAFFSNGMSLGMNATGNLTFGTFWYVAQRESFMIPLIILGLCIAIWVKDGKIQERSLIICGFLLGLVFVYKFPGILFLFLGFMYLNTDIYGELRKKLVNKILRRNLFLVLGFLISIMPFLIYSYVNGIFNEMNNIIFKFVYSVYGSLDQNYFGLIKMGLKHTYTIARENFILWIFFISTSIYFVAKERDKKNLLIVAWAFISLLFVVSHREFFGYHYLLIIPPFAVLTGWGIMKALGPDIGVKQLLYDYPKIFIVLLIVSNLFIFSALNYKHYTRFYRYISGEKNQQWYYQYFSAYPDHDYSFPADYQVAEFINQNSTKEDKIFILGGIEGVIHFLTKRSSPSRFVFSWILFSKTHGRGLLAETYRKELLNDLKNKRPKYIISIRDLNHYQKFKPIHQFITKNYTLVKSLPDDRYIYHLNQEKFKQHQDNI